MTASQKAATLFRDAFDAELLDVGEVHDDSTQWSVAGRGRSKANPAGEDEVWWRTHGPEMVQRWLDWRIKSGWQVWTTPDGQPAIELPIVVDVDGETVKMYIDRVMVEPVTKSLVIVDVKTGSRTPDSDLQLGFYRLGIMELYGIDAKHGAYWMARQGNIGEIFSLERFDPRLMSLWFKRWRTAVDNQIFLPHITTRCRACSMRDYCLAYGGSKSHLDPDRQIVESAA